MVTAHYFLAFDPSLDPFAPRPRRADDFDALEDVEPGTLVAGSSHEEFDSESIDICTEKPNSEDTAVAGAIKFQESRNSTVVEATDLHNKKVEVGAKDGERHHVTRVSPSDDDFRVYRPNPVDQLLLALVRPRIFQARGSSVSTKLTKRLEDAFNRVSQSWHLLLYSGGYFLFFKSRLGPG